MNKGHKVKLNELNNNFIMGESVLDNEGHIMIQKGTSFEDVYIEYLQANHIDSIFVYDSLDDLRAFEESDKSKRIAEKIRVDDPETVKLSQAVKERIGTGVQYLFDNTESDSFINATNSISDELTKAITEHNAIAIDIAQLKVSDEYTFKHSVDVASLSMIIGKRYGLTDEEIREIGVAGLLHDIGKSKIPDAILNKPGKLDDDEFEQMKSHTVLGFRILEKSKHFSNAIRQGVLEHHEKMNGKGYPLGIENEKIHKYARIMSVADVYDALVTERSYKKGFPKKDAIEIIMTMTGDLEMKSMQSFLKSVILYPVDSVVQLSNGKVARVVQNNPDYPLRPKVIDIKDGTVYDLGNDKNCFNILIV